MTNQVNTLTNQDEFLKEYTEITGMQMSYAIDAMRDEDCATVSGRNIHIALLVWQAATKASESEINALKERVKELQAHLSSQVIELALNVVSLESYAHKVAELQASNNQLREALEICKYDCHTGEVIGIAEKALSSTPSQSLAEHDNEVIERCAVVCESLKEQDYCVDVRAGAESIRALKVKP